MGNAQRPIENLPFHAVFAASLLDDSTINLLEQARHRGRHRRMHFLQRLPYRFDIFHVSDRHAFAEVSIADRALIHVGERQEFEPQVPGLDHVAAQRFDRIRTQIRVRQHHALRLAGGPRSVDQRRELIAFHQRAASPVFGHVGLAGRCDKAVVIQNFSAQVRRRRDADQMFHLGHTLTRLGGFARFRFAGGKDDPRSSIVHDVHETIRRLVEINRHARSAEPGNGEIGDVPLRTIRRKQSHAIAGVNPEFGKGFRKSSDPAQHFRRRDGFPSIRGAIHLCFGIGPVVDGVEEEFVK